MEQEDIKDQKLIEEDEELQRLKEEYMQRENQFIKQCEEYGFWRKVIDSDGNCMFAALCTLISLTNFSQLTSYMELLNII